MHQVSVTKLKWVVEEPLTKSKCVTEINQRYLTMTLPLNTIEGYSKTQIIAVVNQDLSLYRGQNLKQLPPVYLKVSTKIKLNLCQQRI